MGASLTRVVGFTARHRYFRPEWTPEQNRLAFGPCAEAPGHAHDYRCAVTVSGPLDPVTGMVTDLGALDQILAEQVTRPLHGKHFNLDIPEFAYGGTIPTCEAVAQYLYERIAPLLRPGVGLERVRVQEDATLYADSTGPA
jgi:6-pyruvoyltetrahydropterin/6-carboxytetrahydropterin synthase